MQNRRWFAVVPLLLASLAACSFDDPGYQWVLDQSTGTPPADTTPITHSFSAIISDVTGDDAFLLQSNLESLDIYTIVLDGTNPAAGSRQSSGRTTSRLTRPLATLSQNCWGFSAPGSTQPRPTIAIGSKAGAPVMPPGPMAGRDGGSG